jgi:hypothetical protein
MKLFIKIIFYANFLFWGGGFLIAFCQFVVYNGFGNVFEYLSPKEKTSFIEKDSVNNYEIFVMNYSYIVNEKEYKDKESVVVNAVDKNDFYIDNIFYNKTIPSLSYVGNNRLKLISAKSGMIIFGFFFLFIFLIYKFADMDKWIGVYTRGEYKSSRK